MLLVGCALAVGCERPPDEYRGKNVAEWIDVWRSDLKGRYEGAETALETIGAYAVPGLIEALDDPSPVVRLHAARTLAKIGPEASSAAPRVAPLLLEDDEAMLRAAAIGLGQWGAEGAEAARPMVVSDDPEARRWAVYALMKTGRHAAVAAPELTRRLADPEPVLVEMAERALVASGDAGAAALAEPLGSEVPMMRGRALEVLANLGGADPDVLRLAVDLLNDPNPNVAHAAEKALRVVGRPVLPLLTSSLERPGPARLRALELMADLEAVAPGDAPRLWSLMKDPDPSIRLAAAVALARAGEGKEHVMGTLVPAFTGGGPKEQTVSADGLVALGELSVAPMTDLVRHGEGDQRARAARVLERIGAPSLAESERLIGMLGSERTELRALATGILAAAGAPAVPLLVPALEAPTPEARFHAAEALERLGHDAAPAAVALESRIAEEPLPWVREKLEAALAATGKAPSPPTGGEAG